MYDAKQIEANALFAGFSDVKINEITYVDSKTQRKMETLSVTFIKPERKIPEEYNKNKNNNNNNNIKVNVLNKKQKYIKKLSRPDNSNAKILHLDLYNKTYFNAVENYSLFKNSCFLPHKFNIQVNKSLKNLNKKNTKKPNLTNTFY